MQKISQDLEVLQSNIDNFHNSPMLIRIATKIEHLECLVTENQSNMNSFQNELKAYTNELELLNKTLK